MVKNQPKPILRVYGKKPRASKTSRRIHFKGFDFFLHRSKAETGGHIMIYWDKVPYPCIKLLVYNDDDDIEEKATEWIDNNLDKVIDKFQRLKDYAHVPREFLAKMNPNGKNNYDIVEGSNRKPFYQLVTVDHNGEYLYLWCNPNEAPTKAL